MKYRTKLCLIALAGGALSLAFFFCGRGSREPLAVLPRPESGEGNEETNLQVRLNGRTYPFHMTLKEIPYSKDERILKLQEASDGLEALFLGENQNLRQITQKVSMPSAYPDSPVEIHWYLDSWDQVGADGAVHNELLKEPVPVKVQAVLSLEEDNLIWEREIQVCPPEDPDVSQRLKILEAELLEAQENADPLVCLPEQFMGEEIGLYPKADDRWIWMLGLTVSALVAVAAGQRREEDEARRRRERGMQLDYPEIVSRLSLYMGAGLSTRKAWERILKDHEKHRDPDPERHAAYEEMRTALREMQSGVAEAAAYERFGTRCRTQAYLKLGTLLGQNLRKGTKNLAELLKEESREAFEDRKALAKRMGEECESRLLLPMMMMLLTILIIIMYPAASSFQM